MHAGERKNLAKHIFNCGRTKLESVEHTKIKKKTQLAQQNNKNPLKLKHSYQISALLKLSNILK